MTLNAMRAREDFELKPFFDASLSTIIPPTGAPKIPVMDASKPNVAAACYSSLKSPRAMEINGPKILKPNREKI
jgi:hypothetical protein